MTSKSLEDSIGPSSFWSTVCDQPDIGVSSNEATPLRPMTASS